MKQLLLLALLTGLIIPTGRAFAWRDGNRYNVCAPMDGTYSAIQIPKDDWESYKANGAFPYEGPETGKKPSGDSAAWCQQHAPASAKPPKPAVQVKSGTSPAPQPAPVSAATLPPASVDATFAPFEGK